MAERRKFCKSIVSYRDPVLRYTGRGRNGFERQWTWRYCRRWARRSGYCAAHENTLDIDIPTPPEDNEHGI